MDFAKPIHPAEVAGYIADNLKAKAQRIRATIASMEAEASALEQASWDAGVDAGRWRQHQPAAPSTEGPTTGADDG